MKERRWISWGAVREGLRKGWVFKWKTKPFLPILGAGMVLAWKGWVLPTCNTDALYLHLPRAVWIFRNGGFSIFERPQLEWAYHGSFPQNYEGMLAGIIALTGNDGCTEWFTTLNWGFLLLTVAALVGLFFERFTWKALASLLMLFSSIPVLILHGATDKVDLAVAVVFVSSLLWLYWWIFEDPRLTTMLLAWSGACLSFGFKKTGLLLIVFLGATILIQCVRSKREVWSNFNNLRAALSMVLVGALLGLSGYVCNLVWYGNLFGAAGPMKDISVSSFFDLRSVFAYPLLLNFVPFSAHPAAVWVPWASEYWYWPASNLFFSHWGILFNGLYVIAFFASPVWVLRCAKVKRQWVLPLTAFGFVLVLTAKSYSYEGGFNSFPRFTLYFSVFLAVFLLWPLLWGLASRSALWTRWIYLGSALFFGGSFIHYLVADAYAPLGYVWDLTWEPSLRRQVASGPNRTPCMVDRMAGPTDVVATDLTYQTWVHPLYGAGLRRPVIVLHLEGERFQIPSEAKWVVADNISTMIWGSVGNRTAGDQLKAFGRGEPSARDTLLFRQMKDDPAFELMASDERGARCIFRRRG